MKAVLIITYYWPPAGGPGIQRWLKFVKYFNEFGIKPIVFIPENPTYPIIDKKFLDEIPPDIQTLKCPIKEPYRFAEILSKKKTKKISSGIIQKEKSSFLEKLMLFIRGNFFIPDARIGWVKPSVKYLKNFLKENKIDVLITTGPPHSLHLIGLELKKEMNIPWLADFRDPWTTIHYHNSLNLTRKSQEKHKALEKKVLDTADLVTVTSPTTKQEFTQKTKTPIELITNGFDTIKKINIERDQEFSISHIGTLLSERNPELLWKVLSDLSNENPNFKKDLKLKFAGIVSEEIFTSLKKYNLFSKTEFRGYVDHSEAVILQHRSQVLLLVEINRPETRAIIPGKLFEYLSSKRPIIAIGPEGSDIKKIINDTEVGHFFNYSQKELLKKIILEYYVRYKNQVLEIDSKKIDTYSRKNLTKNLSNLILSLS